MRESVNTHSQLDALRPNNVWQCTVSPSIDVEVGDIIGINLPRNHMNFAAFGIYFTSPSSFTSYILGSTSASTFSVPGSTTASAQPVLTLDIQEQGINNNYDDLDLILFHTVTETPLLLCIVCINPCMWSAGQSCLDGFPSVTDNTCTSSSCPFQGVSW